MFSVPSFHKNHYCRVLCYCCCCICSNDDSGDGHVAIGSPDSRKKHAGLVSTVGSGIPFARFPTIKCISTICIFLPMSLTVEARNKRESATLNALLSCLLFLGSVKVVMFFLFLI